MSGGSGDATPDTVLSFWFGECFVEGRVEEMETDEYQKTYNQKWFMGGAELDKEVAEKFTDLIRAASNSGLSTGDWATPKGMLARIIMFDQLTRNAFRKQKEAFAYDEEAATLSRRMINEGMLSDLPNSAAMFACMPMMHSEALSDHDLFQEGLKPRAGNKIIDGTLKFDLEHRAVVEKFGRYPHRNSHYGRETTAEEKAWLDSPDCPGWAKSQVAA